MTMIPSRPPMIDGVRRSFSNVTSEAPDTSDVVSSYISETFSGVGSLSSDFSAEKISSLQVTGSPLSEDDYKASPYYRQAIPYNSGMTTESAKALAEYNDERIANGEIISRATTAQSALGVTAAFALGIFEPKNVAYGIAGAVALNPIAAVTPVAASLRRVAELRRTTQVSAASRLTAGDYGKIAAYGAVEGMVAGAAMEPSNRDTADIMQQDYTMSDSLWNIGLSAAFGAGFHAAPPFIREKWDKYKSRASDIVATEIDVATNQLASSRVVDVTPIERAVDGDIAAKPIAENIGKISEYVTKNIDPEFMGKSIPEIAPEIIGKKFDGVVRIPVDKVEYSQPAESIIAQAGMTDAPIEVEINSNGAFTVIDGNHRLKSAIERGDKTIEAVYNVVASQPENMPIPPNATLVKIANDIKTNQIIKSLDNYGGYEQIASRLDAENKAAVSKYIESTIDPDNDTAIDARAIAELEAYEEQLALKKDMAALDEYNAYLKEVAAMKRQGLLSEADEVDMLDAINSVNEKDINKAYEALQICLTRG